VVADVGNIRVLCRVRPTITEDGNSAVVVAVDEDDDTVVNVTRNGRQLPYDCDRAFGPYSSQNEVVVVHILLLAFR